MPFTMLSPSARAARTLGVITLVWVPFWLAYSYLVLTAVRQLGVSAADPLTHPIPALAYGALSMGLALLFALTAWWRIHTGWLRRDRPVWDLSVELIHGLLFAGIWVVSVEIIVIPVFYGGSPFPILDALARTPYRSARIFNGLFLYTVAAAMAHAHRFALEKRATEAGMRRDDSDGEGVADRIRLRVGRQLRQIPLTDVLWFRADGDHVSVITSDAEYALRESLSSLERSLPPTRFARCHRSALVNLERVRSYRPAGSAMVAVLGGGEEVPVSRRFARKLRGDRGNRESSPGRP